MKIFNAIIKLSELQCNVDYEQFKIIFGEWIAKTLWNDYVRCDHNLLKWVGLLDETNMRMLINYLNGSRRSCVIQITKPLRHSKGCYRPNNHVPGNLKKLSEQHPDNYDFIFWPDRSPGTLNFVFLNEEEFEIVEERAW